MYTPEFVIKTWFPPIPNNILEQLPDDLKLYKRHFVSGNFSRSDSFNESLNEWCKINVIPNINYGFQICDGDIGTHVDNRVDFKLFYLIKSGGSKVKTKFWSDDFKTVLKEYCIPENEWFLFRANKPHSVENTNSSRLSVTAKIF